MRKQLSVRGRQTTKPEMGSAPFTPARAGERVGTARDRWSEPEGRGGPPGSGGNRAGHGQDRGTAGDASA